LAEKLTVDDLADMAKRAGLGAPTGVDLPQELAGNIPTPAWLDARYGEKQWTQGTVLNLVIGQGENLVTPLQLARHAAALGNGGRLLRPRLVRDVEASDGTSVRFPPRVDAVWDVSERTRRRIEDALRLTVTHEEGTARGCRIDGLSVAGKTGTAENPHGNPHSWFIGFAPAMEPAIAFAVLVEAGGHGSDAAVPIMRSLLRVWLGDAGDTT
jgi:penicillin-binding protein 2